jgi:putative tryptophan/tyrosine transport system substrate-binding protein
MTARPTVRPAAYPWTARSTARGRWPVCALPAWTRTTRRRLALGFVALLLSILLGPTPILAQPASPMPVVGVLVPQVATDPNAVRAREALESGLAELGWMSGQTVRIEYRYADGKSERLDELARELVALPVDVIVARSFVAIRAAQQATATIPIVMSATGFDPVQLGLVASLARPGGNITGLTLLIQDLHVKQIQLLKEVIPQLTRVAVLGNPAIPLPSQGRDDLDAAGRLLGVELAYFDVRTAAELDRVFDDIARAGAGALIVRADPFVLEANARRVAALAGKYRFPAMYWIHTFPQAGGLMSYGPDLFSVHRRSAFYLDRLLRGARAADLPVEEPTKLNLVLNLKAASAIGLTIPGSFMARVNEVIQ